VRSVSRWQKKICTKIGKLQFYWCHEWRPGLAWVQLTRRTDRRYLLEFLTRILYWCSNCN